jgi:2'-5' RNA ligase
VERVPFAVTLRLDPVSAARVTALWRGLAAAGLSDLAALGYAPHITLAVCGDGATGLAERVAGVAADWHGLAVNFAAVGVFPGPPAVLWLAPTPDAGLLAYQRALCEALPEEFLHPHYRHGAWVPHATLAEDLTAAGLAEAVTLVADSWTPFHGHLTQIDLVHFRPVSVLWQARLAEPVERARGGAT